MLVGTSYNNWTDDKSKAICWLTGAVLMVRVFLGFLLASIVELTQNMQDHMGTELLATLMTQ